jgi:hypothetical protein
MLTGMAPPPDVQLVRGRRLLTPASGFLDGFTHTLNPYVGCAFGDRAAGSTAM